MQTIARRAAPVKPSRHPIAPVRPGPRRPGLADLLSDIAELADLAFRAVGRGESGLARVACRQARDAARRELGLISADRDGAR